jgi:hypothetical protein
MNGEDIAALIGNLAWPVTILVIFFALRTEIARVVATIRRRVADPDTDVKISREGIELHKRVAALEGSAEVQAQATTVLGRVAVPANAAPRIASSEIPPQLTELRDAYLAVDEPDLSSRIKVKNELAHALGATVLSERVDRARLASDGDEVSCLALAAAIYGLPQEGDDLLMIQAGQNVRRLHVRYHVAIAFARLAEVGELTPDTRASAIRLLDQYRQGADDRLLRRIERTLAAVQLEAVQ